MVGIKRIAKRYYLRQIVCCWMIFCMAFILPVKIAMAATPVYTDAGGASIIQGAGTSVTVAVKSDSGP